MSKNEKREAWAGERLIMQGGKLIGRNGDEVVIPEGYCLEVIAVPVASAEGQKLKRCDHGQK